jgi:GT2 family glycosyltransferase
MVSVIIVNYHVKKEFFACLESIYATKPKVSFEIIIVDNDEKKTIQKELQKQFPKVIYIPNENKGFGQGNNVGAKQAKGEYLFFLNPDTRLLNNCIDELFDFLNKHKKAAIVAPLLFDKDNKPYELQGIKELTPFRAIFVLSFINKLFPNNKIFQEYYIRHWDKKNIIEIDAIPGTAFMIKKNIFEKVAGFDEKFFLYFEEFDLCKRVRDAGYQIYIIPNTRIFHAWGSSTEKEEKKKIDKIFQKSRFYYFKKHFGLLQAFFTEAILRTSKITFFLTCILLVGLFLRSFNIYNSMSFIGDQAWFYLSARDIVLTNQIPLVGIASSHPWLHQGPLWTYLLAIGFWFSGFSPFIGAYITIILDMFAIVMMYKVASTMFSDKIALLASFLYATSPLVILNARMPYHTAPIPLVTLMFLFHFYKWITGKINHFPFIILSLVLLYNLELATTSLWFPFFMYFFYGLWKKEKWVMQLRNLKILFFSIVAFIMPMLPILVYDIQNGFPQTFGFLIWMAYKILVFFGYPSLHPDIASPNFQSVLQFLASQYQRLVFWGNGLVAFMIAILSMWHFYKRVLKQIIQRQYQTNFILLAILFTFLLLGFFATKTISDAYLPLLYPFAILITASWLDNLMNTHTLRYAVFMLLFLIFFTNIYTLISTYLTKPFFEDRLSTARQIVYESGGKEYNLVGQGKGSDFSSFTMNYEYLTWWLGHGPSKTEKPLQFSIAETDMGVQIEKRIKN